MEGSRAQGHPHLHGYDFGGIVDAPPSPLPVCRKSAAVSAALEESRSMLAPCPFPCVHIHCETSASCTLPSSPCWCRCRCRDARSALVQLQGCPTFRARHFGSS